MPCESRTVPSEATSNVQPCTGLPPGERRSLRSNQHQERFPDIPTTNHSHVNSSKSGTRTGTTDACSHDHQWWRALVIVLSKLCVHLCGQKNAISPCLLSCEQWEIHGCVCRPRPLIWVSQHRRPSLAWLAIHHLVPSGTNLRPAALRSEGRGVSSPVPIAHAHATRR